MDVEVLRPESLPDALELLALPSDEARVIAGGTALVIMLNQRLLAPRVLVDLTRVPGMAGVREEFDGLHLGPMTRLSEAARAPLVRERYPALAHAYEVVGNVRVRSQATVGGNLAEADYASDPPAMLLALDATVTATSVSGSRSMTLEELLLGAFTTSLEPGEIITDVRLPSPSPSTRSSYQKFTSRSSEDRACVGVGAVAVLEGDVCRSLRVAVGAACEVTTRLPEAEQIAVGQPLTDRVIRQVADFYAQGVDALDDLRGSIWYRRRVIGVYVRRALQEVRGDGR